MSDNKNKQEDDNPMIHGFGSTKSRVTARKFWAFLLLIPIVLAACDGGYFIFPIEETGNNTELSKAWIYTKSNNDIAVFISGGATQRPLTNKVYAGDLYVSVKIESSKPFKINFSRPNIISGGITIGAGRFKVLAQEEGMKRRRIDEKVDTQKNSFLGDEYSFEPGKAWISMRFYSYYNGLGFLSFPLILNLGEVECQGQTLSLTDLKFDATVSMPDSVRDARNEFFKNFQ